MKQILLHERKSHLDALYMRLSGKKKSAFISFLLIFILFFSVPAFAQNTYESLENEIKTRGGIEFGKVEYKLDAPGWWQYYPSCDAGKWISVGQNFEPRADHRARCDLQVHDFESEVAPTLTTTEELIIPADGHLIILVEVNEEEGYEKEPHVKGTVSSAERNDWNVYNYIGGWTKRKPHPSNTYFEMVNKGNKLVFKVDAHIRADAYRRFFFPCKVKLRAFLFPRDGQIFSPEDIQAAAQGLNSSSVGAGASADIGGMQNNGFGVQGKLPGEWDIVSGVLTNKENGNTLTSASKVPTGKHITNTTNKPVTVVVTGSSNKYIVQPGATVVFIDQTNKFAPPKSTISLIAGRLWALFSPQKGKYAVETYNSIAGTTDDFEGEQQVYKSMQEYYIKQYQQAMQKIKNKERSAGNLNETISFEISFDENLQKTTLNVLQGIATFACKNNSMDPVLVDAGNVASFDNNCTPVLNGVVLSGNAYGKAAALSPISDSHVYAYSYSNWNRANWGKYEVLGAGWNHTGGEKRAYLKFDVSGIDKEIFNNAVLRLYHYHTAGGNSSELGVYTIRSAWNEGNGTYNPSKIAASGEISWINQPTIDTYPVAYFNPGSGVNKFVEVDITTLVKSWLNGMPNHGLAIKAGENYLNGPESVYGFYSREYEDADKRPRLIINDNANTSSKSSSSSDTYFFEDFSGGKENYTVDDVNAKISDGKLFWSSGNSGRTTFSWNIPMENIVMEFDGYTESNGFGVHWLNENKLGYSATFGGWFNTKSGTHFGAEGQNVELVGGSVFTVKKWHHYKVVRKGNELSGYCDGTLIFTRIITEKFEGPAKLWFSSWRANFGMDNVKVYELNLEQ